MARNKVFRDPVHKNIEFDHTYGPDALALRLLDTPQVQRLRRVRQLALASQVYHGAEHSRFSHTLGVTHLARALYRNAALNSNRTVSEEAMAVVTASAVLHDVGHPPFSHAVEKVLGVDHEKLTVRAVLNDTPVRDILLDFGGEDFADQVASHVTGESDAETAGVVSSQLDADRMDYILRDGYHAGVPNAQFDVDRILQMSHVDHTGLYFDYRATTAIEGYFISRYHLYLQLYYHKTNRAAEVILRSAFQRARDLTRSGTDLGVDETLQTLFSEGDEAVEAAQILTDHDMWYALRCWRDHEDEILADLSRRLLDRHLFKSLEIEDIESYYERKEDIDDLARSKEYEPSYYVHVDKASDSPYKLVDVTAGDDPHVSIRMKGEGGDWYSLERKSVLVQGLQRDAYRKLRVCVPGEIRDDVAAIVN
jgi:uncharacterized protein